MCNPTPLLLIRCTIGAGSLFCKNRRRPHCDWYVFEIKREKKYILFVSAWLFISSLSLSLKMSNSISIFAIICVTIDWVNRLYKYSPYKVVGNPLAAKKWHFVGTKCLLLSRALNYQFCRKKLAFMLGREILLQKIVPFCTTIVQFLKLQSELQSGEKVFLLFKSVFSSSSSSPTTRSPSLPPSTCRLFYVIILA